MQAAMHQENIVIYRSLRSELASILLLLVLTVMAAYGTAAYSWSVQHVPLGTYDGHPVYFRLPLFAIIPLALLAKILHSLLNYRYILCDEYVLEVRGLWALRRKSIRLNYSHIRGVEISESLWQQLLRIADIQILSDISMMAMPGAAGEHFIEMKGVASPRMIKDMIQTRIHTHTPLSPSTTTDA